MFSTKSTWGGRRKGEASAAPPMRVTMAKPRGPTEVRLFCMAQFAQRELRVKPAVPLPCDERIYELDALRTISQCPTSATIQLKDNRALSLSTHAAQNL